MKTTTTTDPIGNTGFAGRTAGAALLGMLAGAIGAGCGSETTGDRGAGECGVVDPDSGTPAYCSGVRTEYCVCATERCATEDPGCPSGYRYATGAGECVAQHDAPSAIPSDSPDDLCSAGTDAGADADADRSADADAGDDEGEPVCGNGVVEEGEECDDRNGDDGDDCLNNCRIARCGDGVVRGGVEQCDGAPRRDCTTTCGSTGTQACVDCRWEATCTLPEEVCNGADDDCDTLVDEFGDGLTPFACGDGCCNGADNYCDCPADCPTPVARPMPPRLVSPANGALAPRRLTFRWAPPTGGGCGTPDYEIQVDDTCAAASIASCDFPSPEHSLASIPYPRLTLGPLAVRTTPPVGRRYYWRVRACDGEAGCSSWSDARYVDVGRVPSDFNGDGYSDLAVGSRWSDNIGPNFGHILIYRGSASGLSATPAWGLNPPDPQTGSEFGAALATADLDSDGFADLIAGAPSYDVDIGSEGRVWVFRGSAAGPSATPAATIDSPDGQAGARFGATIAAAGDTNYDGFPDLLVAAPYWDGGGGLADTGRVYLYQGSATGVATTPGETIAHPDPQADAFFGWVLSCAGDVDLDGTLDIAVGAPFHDAGAINEGNVFLFASGRPAARLVGTLDNPDNQAYGWFGFTITLMSDLDDDGHPELVVGAPAQGAEREHEGAIFVYFGSPTGYPSTPSIRIDNPAHQAIGFFGAAVAALGGPPSGAPAFLAVAAPDQDNPFEDQGIVYVYVPGAGGLPAMPTAELVDPATAAHANFGEVLGAGWDFDGSGYPDIVVGEPDYRGAFAYQGRAFAYYGTAGGVPAAPSRIIDVPVLSGDVAFGAALGRGL